MKNNTKIHRSEFFTFSSHSTVEHLTTVFTMICLLSSRDRLHYWSKHSQWARTDLKNVNTALWAVIPNQNGHRSWPVCCFCFTQEAAFLTTSHGCPEGTSRPNFSKTEIISFPPTNLLLPPASPISAHGNSILPAAQARTLECHSWLLSFNSHIHPSADHGSVYFQNICKIPPSFLLFLCYLPGPNSVLPCPDWSPTSKPLLISGWFYVQNTSPVLAFSLFLLLPPWSKRHHLLPGLGWWLLTGIPGPPLPPPV